MSMADTLLWIKLTNIQYQNMLIHGYGANQVFGFHSSSGRRERKSARGACHGTKARTN
jgi:hypothetical protein